LDIWDEAIRCPGLAAPAVTRKHKTNTKKLKIPK
jgi:hypothetical protein